MRTFKAYFSIAVTDLRGDTSIPECAITFQSDCHEGDMYSVGEAIVKSIPGAGYSYTEPVE